MLLELKDLEVRYGQAPALRGISMKVGEGEIVTILGANGAGKSTTLMAISGLIPTFAGEIIFDGASIHRRPAHEIVKLGITQAPEGRR
ncbi:MAG: ATP-binding cassette domain-containing protein, partial [Syntrophales bacterium]|nr:ATP-binding cassette domain-containing protein [Syntrophales bacterium]